MVESFRTKTPERTFYRYILIFLTLNFGKPKNSQQFPDFSLKEKLYCPACLLQLADFIEGKTTLLSNLRRG